MSITMSTIERIGCLVILTLGLTFTQVEVAQADRPKGKMVFSSDVSEPQNFNSRIIYLNRCKGGCKVWGGYPNNSSTDVSSIVRGTKNISEFNGNDAAWNEIVQCVTLLYEPFNIKITDQDPGSEDHFEAIVAGMPGEAGFDQNTGGVSPFGCGVINNAITFTFANMYGGALREICETVAQESAHAFGLDHEMHCPDPMTYLTGCGDKEFRDVNAYCGEYQNRQCYCGNSTQNSFATILGMFGAGPPTTPSVEITEPLDGAQVQSGFVVRANISDNVSITKGELWVNDELVSSISVPPYIFNAPTGLADGAYKVSIRGYDNRNDYGEDTIYAIIGAPCGDSDDCNSGDVCVDGRCVSGPDQSGGLGSECTDNEDCVSGLCGAMDGLKLCVETCLLGNNGCPGGFQCIAAGENGVCWPGAEDSGGCLSSTQGTPPFPWILLFFAATFLAIRMRSRKNS